MKRWKLVFPVLAGLLGVALWGGRAEWRPRSPEARPSRTTATSVPSSSVAAAPSRLVRELPSDSVLAEALDALPSEFDRYRELRRHVLHTREDLAELDAAAKDVALAKSAERLLLRASDQMSWKESEARLAAIDFIAWAWGRSGERPDLEDAVARVLEDSTGLSERLPSSVRRMVAGDKVELFLLLSRHAPLRASALRQRLASEGSLGRIVAFADRMAAQRR